METEKIAGKDENPLRLAKDENPLRLAKRGSYDPKQALENLGLEPTEGMIELVKLAQKIIGFYDYQDDLLAIKESTNGGEISSKADELAYRVAKNLQLVIKQARNLISESGVGEKDKEPYMGIYNLKLGEKALEDVFHAISKDIIENYALHAVQEKRNLEGVSIIDEDPGYVRPKESKIEDNFLTLLMTALTTGTEGGVLIVGDTGTGKTLSVKQLAYTLTKNSSTDNGYMALLPVMHSSKVSYIRIQCTSEDGKNMVGRTALDNGSTKFEEGPIIKAIEAANANGFAILLFDEIGALQPDAQKILNRLLEDRSVSYQNNTYKVNKDARLFVVATTNDYNKTGYGGTNQLNTDLGRRFTIKINVDISDEDLKEVIKEVAGTNDEALIDKLLLLAQHTRGERVSIPISPATLINFVDEYKKFLSFCTTEAEAFRRAMEGVIINSYTDPSDFDAMRDKVGDIFGADALKRPTGKEQSGKSGEGVKENYQIG